mmetsp:Transcript_30714/g.68909  ORF Transcript_30714/g.68909 Transcript_30714/m.68909 type:complete len:323 (-) Transcript_30714:456-1424(-)
MYGHCSSTASQHARRQDRRRERKKRRRARSRVHDPAPARPRPARPKPTRDRRPGFQGSFQGGDNRHRNVQPGGERRGAGHHRGGGEAPPPLENRPPYHVLRPHHGFGLFEGRGGMRDAALLGLHGPHCALGHPLHPRLPTVPHQPPQAQVSSRVRVRGGRCGVGRPGDGALPLSVHGGGFVGGPLRGGRGHDQRPARARDGTHAPAGPRHGHGDDFVHVGFGVREFLPFRPARHGRRRPPLRHGARLHRNRTVWFRQVDAADQAPVPYHSPHGVRHHHLRHPTHDPECARREAPHRPRREPNPLRVRKPLRKGARETLTSVW